MQHAIRAVGQGDHRRRVLHHDPKANAARGHWLRLTRPNYVTGDIEESGGVVEEAVMPERLNNHNHLRVKGAVLRLAFDDKTVAVTSTVPHWI